jgi:hypothetical protein
MVKISRFEKMAQRGKTHLSHNEECGKRSRSKHEAPVQTGDGEVGRVGDLEEGERRNGAEHDSAQGESESALAIDEAVIRARREGKGGECEGGMREKGGKGERKRKRRRES